MNDAELWLRASVWLVIMIAASVFAWLASDGRRR